MVGVWRLSGFEGFVGLGFATIRLRTTPPKKGNNHYVAHILPSHGYPCVLLDKVVGEASKILHDRLEADH